MAKTTIDGYPDDPWIEELSNEINNIVTDAERRIANAPLIGRQLFEKAMFDRDCSALEPEVFGNDPYKRIYHINLN